MRSTRDEKVGNKHRIEEILVSSSSLVSGLSEASGVRFSWVEVSQESLKTLNLHNSALIPPTGFLLSEDLDTTYSFILTEYDLDLTALSGSYEGLKFPKKV